MTIDGGTLYVSSLDTGEIRKYDTATDTFLGDFIATGPGAFDLLVVPAVPEPRSAALFLVGLAVLAGMFRRKKLS